MKHIKKVKGFNDYLLTKYLLFFITLFLAKPALADQTFTCGSETYRGEVVPTTYVNPEAGGNPIPMIYWVEDYFPSPPPEVRCSTATGKLQAYYDNGQLEFINTDIVNGLPVICVALQVSNRCSDSDIILTLHSGVDRFAALRRMMYLTRQAGSTPLAITDDLVVYSGGEAYVDIDIFIESLQDQ